MVMKSQSNRLRHAKPRHANHETLQFAAVALLGKYTMFIPKGRS